MSKIYDIDIVDIQSIGLLTNPSVGSIDAIRAAGIARQRFNDAGVNVVSIQAKDATTTERYTRELLKADDIDAIVICGDDPLINVVLQAQAGSSTPLGLIPAGELTDLGRSLNLPLNPKRAADIIMRGFCTTTDLGKMTNHIGESRWFATIACSGYGARVTQRAKKVPSRLRAIRTPLAAILSAVDLRATPCRITLDNDRIIEDDILLCAVGNTQYYGQGMMICPEANHHDGLLDISVVTDDSIGNLARNFFKIYQSKPDRMDAFDYYRAMKVTIEHEGQPNAADCRPFSEGYLEIEAKEGAGRFLVPRP